MLYKEDQKPGKKKKLYMHHAEKKTEKQKSFKTTWKIGIKKKINIKSKIETHFMHILLKST